MQDWLDSKQGKLLGKYKANPYIYLDVLKSEYNFGGKNILPDWVEFSKNIPLDFEYQNDDKFIWKDGIWKDGIWKDGIWKDGTWEGGTWEFGIWKGGTWEFGIWKGGWILDKGKKGNFESEWEWIGNYVKSTLRSPKEYFK